MLLLSVLLILTATDAYQECDSEIHSDLFSQNPSSASMSVVSLTAPCHRVSLLSAHAIWEGA